jgi:hypothetical protein
MRIANKIVSSLNGLVSKSSTDLNTRSNNLFSHQICATAVDDARVYLATSPLPDHRNEH